MIATHAALVASRRAPLTHPGFTVSIRNVVITAPPWNLKLLPNLTERVRVAPLFLPRPGRDQSKP